MGAVKTLEDKPDLKPISTDVLLRSDTGTGMCRKVSEPDFTSHRMQVFPYYAWSNRVAAEMTSFMPVIWMPPPSRGFFKKWR